MTTYFVDQSATSGADDGTSWEDAYLDPDDALTVAGSGDEIWIKEGAKYTLAANLTALASGAKIYGGFARWLRGTSGSTSTRHEYAYTVIYGAGAYRGLQLSGSNTVDKIIFDTCYIAGDGGGIYGNVDSSTINDCKFLTCTCTNDGGGIYLDGNSNTISDCKFDSCTATDDGGAIALYGDDTNTNTVQDCTIDDCAAGSNGGGIFVSMTGESANDVLVKNSIIKNCAANSGDGGGLFVDEGAIDVIAVNCVMHDNSAGDGGAVATASGTGHTLDVSFCTLADNTATGNGDAVYRNGGTLNVTSCILQNGGTDEISGTVTTTYSNVEGGEAGTGNIDVEPYFTASGSHPYSISRRSNCVDGADSGATGYLSTDILGNSRYDDPNQTNNGTGSPAYADMGAYEWQGVPEASLSTSSYKVICDHIAASTTGQPFRFYALIPMTPLPEEFQTDGVSGLNMRLQVEQELLSGDANNTWVERVIIDNVTHAVRTGSGLEATVTRDVAFDTAYQSDGSSYVAEIDHYPVGEDFIRGRLDDGRYQFAVVQITYEWDKDSAGDKLFFYTADITPIPDNTSYAGMNFEASPHPNTTKFAPDQPLDSWSMQVLLTDSLRNILIESGNPIELVLYGSYMAPVV